MTLGNNQERRTGVYMEVLISGSATVAHVLNTISKFSGYFLKSCVYSYVENQVTYFTLTLCGGLGLT